MSGLAMFDAANQEIALFLARHAAPAEAPASLVGLDELRTLQRCLREVAPHVPAWRTRDGAQPPAVAQYFRHLQQLLPVLQAAEPRLVAERNVLKGRGAWLSRAHAWAGAFRSVL